MAAGNFMLISGRGEFKLKAFYHLMMQVQIYRAFIIILYSLGVKMWIKYTIRIKYILTETTVVEDDTSVLILHWQKR